MNETAESTPDPERRAAWLLELRRENERQEDALAPEYDAEWGEIDDDHRAFIERFLAELPPGGRVLDAPCGTGKYFAMVLASGRRLQGVDHSAGYLARAVAKHPEVPTERLDLQDVAEHDAFDGVMCVDAMEFMAPEDWPLILARFRDALHPGGWLYLTVERVTPEAARVANDEARRAGLPVVEGEVIWDDPFPYYHHYPSMDRVRDWLGDAGFEIVVEAEGPWHDDEYAYHHVLARLRAVKA